MSTHLLRQALDVIGLRFGWHPSIASASPSLAAHPGQFSTWCTWAQSAALMHVRTIGTMQRPDMSPPVSPHAIHHASPQRNMPSPQRNVHASWTSQAAPQGMAYSPGSPNAMSASQINGIPSGMPMSASSMSASHGMPMMSASQLTGMPMFNAAAAPAASLEPMFPSPMMVGWAGGMQQQQLNGLQSHASLNAMQQQQQQQQAPPPPAKVLALERLLSSPTLDAVLTARTHARQPHATSVSDITRANNSVSLVELPRSLSMRASVSSVSQLAAAGSGPITFDTLPLASTSSGPMPTAHSSTAAKPSLPHIGSARRNPWDDEDEEEERRGNTDKGKPGDGVWENAVANALAAVEREETTAAPHASPAPGTVAAAGVGGVSSGSAAQASSSVQQLQLQLVQLQVLQQKQEELKALQARAAGQGQGSPSSPASSASYATSLAPQAPLHELQRANLKRSSSSSNRGRQQPAQQGTPSLNYSPTMASWHQQQPAMGYAGSPGMTQQQQQYGGVQGGTSVASFGQGTSMGNASSPSSTTQSFVSGISEGGSPHRRMTKRSSSKRGAYPEFLAGVSPSRRSHDSTSAFTSEYGDDPPERHSAPAATSSASQREKRHTHTSGMTEEPWGGAFFARGFAAVKSYKQRESTTFSSPSGTGGGAAYVLQETRSVTITGPEPVRVLGHSLTGGGGSGGYGGPGAYGGVARQAVGAGGAALFPAYTRPGGPGEARTSGGGDGRRTSGASGGPDRSNHRALSIHEEEDEDEPSEAVSTVTSTTFNTSSVATRYTQAPASVTQMQQQLAFLQQQAEAAAAARHGSGALPASGGGLSPLGSPSGTGGGATTGGGASGPRLLAKMPSFGAALGGARFKVQPQLVDGTPGRHAGAGVPVVGVGSGDLDGPNDVRQRPIRGSASLTRAQQRAALGSHQITITMNDFTPTK